MHGDGAIGVAGGGEGGVAPGSRGGGGGGGVGGRTKALLDEGEPSIQYLGGRDPTVVVCHLVKSHAGRRELAAVIGGLAHANDVRDAITSTLANVKMEIRLTGGVHD